MDLIDKYEIRKRKDLSERDCLKVDSFIMKESTTGEFINTFKFLEYHPKDRFVDDSIVVVDCGSQEVKGVMLAAQDGCGGIISHPGTTFAGPIVDREAKLDVIQSVMDIMLGYYEKKYQQVKIKKIPEYYMQQPFQLIDYILLRRGYSFGMSAMANIININQIDSEEDILKLFDSKKRNHTRKVLKEKNFVFSSDDIIRGDVWENMNANLKNKFDSKTTHTLEEIRNLKERCPSDIKAFYVDHVNGEYAAFALGFFFKNVFHTQYLDVNYKYTGQYPNLLLVLKMIGEARKMGYSFFSFGASTEDEGSVLNTGLYNYKSGYGGGAILLPVYNKSVGGKMDEQV